MLFNNTKITYLRSDDALKKNGFAYGEPVLCWVALAGIMGQW